MLPCFKFYMYLEVTVTKCLVSIALKSETQFKKCLLFALPQNLKTVLVTVGLFLTTKCVKSRFLSERRRRKWTFAPGTRPNVAVKPVTMVRLEKHLLAWLAPKERLFHRHRSRECWKYTEISLESSHENDAEVMERFIWTKLAWNENRLRMDDCREP